ncbi:50S ribosomal protein L25 [Candidatus Dojkabacteria bacterium]|uniref:Large ribosomal subunit protein bL25 n=1 Tax=Candidatus Dojkabacteria bacterium TaxID=2099670 RepID=A0A3M0Z2G4_9BACT|nr:MAG: 50S ribosomal protein L25 [Candidatus Dojkabacteria bacterium]
MEIEVRKVLGKKCKSLRKQGLVTGSIYGPGFETIYIQMPLNDLLKIEKTYGTSTFFDVTVGEQNYSVVLKNVYRHPVTMVPLNVDFYKPNLEKKMQAKVPIHFVGESPAEKAGLGFLLFNEDSVLVQSLPKNLPSYLEVDISTLSTTDSVITFGDIILPDGVEFDSSVNLSSVVVSIGTNQKDNSQTDTKNI